MDRFRLRGTWEEDPAPIPFPRGNVAGRNAGTDTQTPSPASRIPETRLSEQTRELMTNIDQELDRLQIKFSEYRELLDSEEERGDDGPSAA